MADALNQKIGQVCKRLIEAAKRSRKRFMDSGREIMRYGFSPEFQFEYQTLAANAFFKAKCGKTSEAIQIFVPLVWQEIPDRLLTARDWIPPWKLPRMKVRSDYLNYIIQENDHAQHSKRALIESVCYGEGVRWTGRHPEKNIVYSAFDSVRNLLKDPNARVPEEMQWVARRRCRPKYIVKRENPDIAGVIDRLPAVAKRESDKDSQYDWEKSDNSTDCIVYYEMWFKVGIHNFQGGTEILKDLQAQSAQQGGEAQVDDSPKKYLVHEDGTLMKVGEWEVPFFIRGMWPCEIVSYYGNPDSIWSVSPLEPGIGYQRAMNWIITLLMGKYRFTSKTLLALKKQNGQGVKDSDVDKILVGADIDAIQIDVKGEKKSLKDFLEKFEYNNDYIEAGLRLFSQIENLYEKSTGLYGSFYSEQGGTQERSAEAVRFKEQNTNLRVNQMRAEVNAWESRISVKEDFAANFLMKREDIAPIMGPQAAQAWGYMVPEGQDDPQSIMQEIVQKNPQMRGAPPQILQQMAMQEASQRYTIQEIALDADYQIESSSTKRRDVQARIDALKELSNQVVPMQLQSGDPAQAALAYQSLAEYYKDIGCSEDLVKAMQGMAARLQTISMGPPPGAPGGAPPPGNGPPQKPA